MSVIVVSPREGLIASVLERLHPHGKDYTRLWVVFPERRPGYYLRKALARREGTAFLSPRIDSLDAFVDRVYRERLGRRDKSIDALDAVALLFDIHRDSPGRMGGGHFLTADQFFPLGMKLFRDLEEMAAAAVSAADLARTDGWTEDALPESARRRLQSLSLFYERFYESLARRGYATPGSRLRDVAAGIGPALFEDLDRVILAGFFPSAGGEAALLKAVSEWPNGDVLFQTAAGLGEALDRIGLAGPGLRAETLKKEEAEAAGAVLEFIESPDAHGQVFALNAALADKLAEPSCLDERSVIVLPAAETLFPLHQQTLAALPVEGYNISIGYPLSRTPLAGFFDRLLELIQSTDEEGRVYAPHYLRFLLHPYTKNIYLNGRADLTRILVHAVEGELHDRRTRAFWGLEELEADTGIRAAVAERTRGVEGAPDPAAFMNRLASIHASLITPFRAVRDVREFAAKLAAALAFIQANSTARRHVFFHPYAEAFRDRLEALGRSLLGPTVFGDRASYFNLFRKVVAAGTVPFEGTPLRGLQVLGFWETRGLPFRDVSILDLNEDVLPASRRVDSLLPYAARRALGLPTYKDAERRAGYCLDALRRGADHVRIFYVRSKDREPSRFVAKLLWESQKRDKEPLAARLVRKVRYQVALQTPPLLPVAKEAGTAAFLRSFAFSATALDTYLRCPLQFHRRYILGLKEREELGEEPEARDVGSFVHSVLEEYFQPFVGRPLRAADLNPAAMEALVERRFEKAFGPEASGGLYLMRRQIRTHLREFLTGYQAEILAGLQAEGRELRILGLERKLAFEWDGTLLPLSAGPEGPVRDEPFRLTATIDRIELRGDELCVLDYKSTGRTTYLGIVFDKLDLDDRLNWARHVASLQLPFYHLILSRTVLPPAADDGASSRSRAYAPDKIQSLFLMLGRQRLSPGIEFPAFGGGKRMRELEKALAAAGVSDAEKTVAREERSALAAGRAALMEKLTGRLLAEITDPGFPFDPALRRPEACDRCPYAALCGR
ncbi:MAG: PD-(D/E)XK nuclease family protein [Acidobacteriota bacterium]|nr:PD-(D/E)XK nuclease family protein [Acidobacteriota bacterium]